MSLDERFEVRTLPSGAQVVVLKGEVTNAPAAKKNKKTKKNDASIMDVVDSVKKLAVTSDASADKVEEKTYVPSTLSLDERFDLVRAVGEEIIQEDELKKLLAAKVHPVCYDGFEPSGRMHIAQGLMKAINVNRLTKAGCVFKFWVADWFAMLNNKMGGDLKKIRVVGQYMIEVWKAAGMNMDNVEFLWASEEINKRPEEYWSRVMDIAMRNSLTRVRRCCTIMGRTDGDEMTAAQIFYPVMQAADIFFLKADICQLGMDQRRVNMLAREYCDAAKIRYKPVVVSHHMLAGLKEGQEKMSKSDPDSAIFMEDTVEDVRRKIRSAYCPPNVVKSNPCLEYVRYIVFGMQDSWTVPRKHGEPVTFNSPDEVEKAYESGELHPGDLKPALTEAINSYLDPIRKHFSTGPAKELLKRVRGFKITR